MTFSRDWRCWRCGTSNPGRHYYPCLARGDVLTSPAWALLPLVDLGVACRALRAFRRGVRLVLVGRP